MHTPPPWTFDPGTGEVRHRGALVARVMLPGDFPAMAGGSFRESFAVECGDNGRLIAEAPALLEAVEIALIWLEPHGGDCAERFEDYKRLQALVARVKGEAT